VQRTVSGITGGGLTWAKYGAYSGADPRVPTRFVSMEIWWATAASALTATTFAITMSGAPDDMSYVVFGVNGAATPTAPWDTGGPFTGVGTSDVNFSTAGQDFIIGAWGASSSQSITTAKIGSHALTNIANADNGGGSQWSYLSALYLSTATYWTSAAASNLSGSTTITGIVGAILGTGAGTPGTSNARLTQAALAALTENSNAKARITQAYVAALTENTNANARLTQAYVAVLTDPPVVSTQSTQQGAEVAWLAVTNANVTQQGVEVMYIRGTPLLSQWGAVGGQWLRPQVVG
jgi:hypothetical protein